MPEQQEVESDSLSSHQELQQKFARFNPGMYVIVGFYANRYEREYGKIRVSFEGRLAMIAASSSPKGFESFIIEGRIKDDFGLAKIEGWTDNETMEFKKIYELGKKREIEYCLSRQSDILWNGEYALTDSEGKIKGEVACLIAPRVVHMDSHLTAGVVPQA